MPERRGTSASKGARKAGIGHRREHQQHGRGRRVQRQQPAQRQGGQQHGRCQRPAQVVQHLAQADRRQPAVRRARPQHPRQQLPVAAGPAVLALRGDVVAGREFLDHLDIGRQPGAREDAFEQIVAEQGVRRHAAGERRLEGVDVVDALAGVGAFAEQVLVHVGGGSRVRIDAARRGEQPLVQRAFAADRQRRRHARLQDAVAADHALARLVEARPVQGMRHLADQPQRRVARQPRVGIERDDVAHAAPAPARRRRPRRTRCRSRRAAGD